MAFTNRITVLFLYPLNAYHSGKCAQHRVQPTRLSHGDFPRWDAEKRLPGRQAPCQPAGARLTQGVGRQTSGLLSDENLRKRGLSRIAILLIAIYRSSSSMLVEIAVSLLAGVLSLLLPILERLFWYTAERSGIARPRRVETYSDKLARLTESLTKSSAEVDGILAELTQVAQERERTVRDLETQLIKLTEDEKQTKQRIQDLQNTPLPVAEHFAKLTESGEKRSARRDYLLFGAGVLVSTVITIILSLLGISG